MAKSANKVWGPNAERSGMKSYNVYPGGATPKESKVKGKIGVKSSESKGKYIYGSDKNPKAKISREFNKGPIK